MAMTPIQPRSVFFDWMMQLPMQQQSVLVLALRGPDGAWKRHPTKRVLRAYRATVLKQAFSGQSHIWGAPGDSFGGLDEMADKVLWKQALEDFFAWVDSIPHHYYMHLMHGAQILGYHHPDPQLRLRWLEFYHLCADDLHLAYETQDEMDRRLNDGNQEGWQ